MSEYRLRKLDGAYVAVAVGETSKNFHGIVKLNSTAAEIFKMMQDGLDDGKIAEKLSEEYGISTEQAEGDVKNIRQTLEDSKKATVSIEEIIARDGVFISTTAGMSMYPLLKNRRDNIVVRPVKGRLKKYDVPLYKRGNEYVLHRVIEVKEDSYVILGDNCVFKEYGITDKDILGVATGFYRRNRYVSADSPIYRLYSRVWVFIYPVRMFYKKIKSKAFGVLSKLKRLANKK